MALKGTIIDLGNGKLGFNYTATEYNEPLLLRQVWEIAQYRTSGMSYCRAPESIGREATISDGRVSCYLGNGNYLTGELAQLGSTHSIILERTPIPRPKTRVETRWYNGRWEKLMKRGWVPA